MLWEHKFMEKIPGKGGWEEDDPFLQLQTLLARNFSGIHRNIEGPGERVQGSRLPPGNSMAILKVA